MKAIFLALALMVTQQVSAATARDVQADTIHATGGASLSMPSTGTAVVTDTATQTLTGKTLSGASNTFSNIPASAVSSGTLGVANGGTGSSTLTSGSVVVGNGTSAVSLVAPSTSGNVLTSNGTTWVSSAPAATGGIANVVASAGSPQSVTAGAGVSVTGQIVNGPNVVFVQGSGGAVTVTATPSITACTAAGEMLTLVGESATNTVTLQDNAGLAGSKLQLNGNITLGLNSTISFVCDAAAGDWVEVSRR